MAENFTQPLLHLKCQWQFISFSAGVIRTFISPCVCIVGGMQEGVAVKTIALHMDKYLKESIEMN